MESRISTSNNNSPLRKVSKMNGLNFSNETLSSLKKSPKHIHSRSKHNSNDNSSNLKTQYNSECGLGNDLFDDILTGDFDLDIPLEEFISKKPSPTNTNKNKNHTRSSSFNPKPQPKNSLEQNNSILNKNSSFSSSETYKQLPPRNRNEQKDERSNSGDFENSKGLSRLPLPLNKSEIIKSNAFPNKNFQTTCRRSTNESKNQILLSNSGKILFLFCLYFHKELPFHL